MKLVGRNSSLKTKALLKVLRDCLQPITGSKIETEILDRFQHSVAAFWFSCIRSEILVATARRL